MKNRLSASYFLVITTSFSLQDWNKGRLSLPVLFDIVLKSLTKQSGRKIKGVLLGKEITKLSSFIDDIIVYVEKYKESMKLLLDLVSEVDKFAWYNIHKQKSNSSKLY